ncbi:MAG: ADP-ribosylation factor-like protein [Promethearchaeota archaeon]
MLRQVFVLHESKILMKKNFGNALGENSLKNLISQIQESISTKKSRAITIRDFFNYRVAYSFNEERKWIFILITDLTDNQKDLKKQMGVFISEFDDFFSDIDEEELGEETINIFNPRIEKIHNNLRPKISLVGYSGVGKTTISRLIRDDEIPKEHIPTMTGDIQTVKIGKLYFNLWDNAGQESFKKLWPKFIKGSDAVLVVTDSSKENVEETKFFLDLWRDVTPYARICIIANKQDLDGAMSPSEVSEIMEGIQTYGIVANKEENKEKMIQIVAKVLEVNASLSPLLKPIFERDKMMDLASEAIASENFAVAKKLFEEISRISLDLGDDKLAFEFYERAIQIGAVIAPVPEEEKLFYELKDTHPTIAESDEIDPNIEAARKDDNLIKEKNQKTKEIPETTQQKTGDSTLNSIRSLMEDSTPSSKNKKGRKKNRKKGKDSELPRPENTSFLLGLPMPRKPKEKVQPRQAKPACIEPVHDEIGLGTKDLPAGTSLPAATTVAPQAAGSALPPGALPPGVAQAAAGPVREEKPAAAGPVREEKPAAAGSALPPGALPPGVAPAAAGSALPPETPHQATTVVRPGDIPGSPASSKESEITEISRGDSEQLKTQVISRISLIEKYIMELELKNLDGELTDEEFDKRKLKLFSIKRKLEKKLMTVIKATT